MYMNQSKFIDVPNLRIPASQKIAAKLSQQQQPKSKLAAKTRYSSLASTSSASPKDDNQGEPEVPQSSNTRLKPCKPSDGLVAGCACLSAALLLALCILAGFQTYFLSKVAGIDGDVLRVTKMETQTQTLVKTEWVASETGTTTKIVSVVATATEDTKGVLETSVALQHGRAGQTSLVERWARTEKSCVKTIAFTA